MQGTQIRGIFHHARSPFEVQLKSSSRHQSFIDHSAERNARAHRFKVGNVQKLKYSEQLLHCELTVAEFSPQKKSAKLKGNLCDPHLRDRTTSVRRNPQWSYFALYSIQLDKVQKKMKSCLLSLS